MSKVGINGFGRIGRLVLRRLLEVKSNIDVVAINDLTSPKILAYLLKHDSNYGPFPWSVDYTEDSLIVDGKSIAVYAEKEAKKFGYTDEEIVSSDIIGSHFGSVFDATQTEITAVGDLQLVKTVAWYDNEYGFVTQLIRTLEKFAKL
ncbi:TPA: aldehyde dehydrogenase [Escherichia coli]|nr:aldehyde dehydrogenase [Escherichia coli]